MLDLDQESKRNICPWPEKENFHMERTSHILLELQNELKRRLEDIEAGRNPSADWTSWFTMVDELRGHLSGQLEDAAPRFAPVSLGVSATASHAAILESINSFKSQI